MPSSDPRLALALSRHRQGDVAGASLGYRAVLADNPQEAEAMHMLGVIAQQAGNSDLALKLMEASLAVAPDVALAWHNRSLVLRASGRSQDALLSSQHATELAPDMAEAHEVTGSIFRERRQFRDAHDALQRALDLQPENPTFLTSMMVLLTAEKRLKEAWALAQKLVRHLDVSSANGIGNLLKASGRPRDALRWFREASAFKSDFHGGRLNEAMALLQMGDLAAGLPLWEQRLLDPTRPAMPFPAWQGERVSHLLLLEDQGMGDALQCLRFIPVIQPRVGRITLRLGALLCDIIRPSFPGIDVITLDDPLPQADAAAQLMSLPALCSLRFETLSPGPYLRALPAWREVWKERLGRRPGKQIGLVWGGNPGNRQEYERSVTFAQLKPIIDLGADHFVALQKGPQSNPDELADAGVFDAGALCTNFSDTAGLMEQLDLVITICSSPMHLAGALGRPTWLMLHFDPHWVWLLGREDSPWYGSARLFRQPAPGAWGEVISEVSQELKRFLAGDDSVLKPPAFKGAPFSQNPLAVDLGPVLPAALD